MAEYHSRARGVHTLQPGIQSSTGCPQEHCRCAGEPSRAVRQARMRAPGLQPSRRCLRQEPDGDEEEDDRKKGKEMTMDDDESDHGYSE